MEDLKLTNQHSSDSTKDYAIKISFDEVHSEESLINIPLSDKIPSSRRAPKSHTINNTLSLLSPNQRFDLKKPLPSIDEMFS